MVGILIFLRIRKRKLNTWLLITVIPKLKIDNVVVRLNSRLTPNLKNFYQFFPVILPPKSAFSHLLLYGLYAARTVDIATRILRLLGTWIIRLLGTWIMVVKKLCDGSQPCSFSPQVSHFSPLFPWSPDLLLPWINSRIEMSTIGYMSLITHFRHPYRRVTIQYNTIQIVVYLVKLCGSWPVTIVFCHGIIMSWWNTY